LVAAALALWPAGPAGAQLWSGVLAPARAIDWSGAGVTTGIPTSWANCVTSQCNTVNGGTVTTASVNAAITSAPANTVVRIPAGSFTLSGGISVNNHNNVILRGAGADQTTLTVTGTCSLYYLGFICIAGA